MREQTGKMVTEWLRKARNDLVSARQILKLSDGPTDTVCFHAQQAVEKSLKALLTANEVEFPQTHHLVRLLDLSLPFLDDLDRFRVDLAEMDAYAVEFRYPGSWSEPSRSEAEIAVVKAEVISGAIRKRLVPQE